MCGICGYISNREWNQKAMLTPLKHRGPNNTGQFSFCKENKNIFFGHTRLSIIDLSSNGNQPMTLNNGQIAISYNGEIYNFRELKNEFLKNQSFHSNTDTEVVLQLYKQQGISFIKNLNGDFAISILDLKGNKLYLIRDRMGVKPLYYYHQNQTLAFASEIKSLIHSGILPKLNEKNILPYFAFKYVPGNETLFENIYRLPPAHYLEYDFQNNTTSIHSYWQPSFNGAYNNITLGEAKKVCYSLVEDACRIRLVADVSIGNFLSGGLDSSIIAYFLKNEKSIFHYCARKNEKDLEKEGTTSDYTHAKKLAEEWNLSLKEIPINSQQLTKEILSKTINFSDDLIADGSQIPSFLITEKASISSRVILTGMGADEIFFGYAGHQLLLLSSYLDKLPKSASHFLASQMTKLNVGKSPFKAFKRYLYKLGKYYQYPSYKYGIYSIVGDWENSISIYKDDSDMLIDFMKNYFPNNQSDPFQSLMQFEKDNFLVKNLHYMDRMSMANSVECRVPFLDHRLVEFAWQLKREYKLSNFGKPKKILKETFSDILPSYILNRRKAGFGMPLRSIFSNPKKVSEFLDLSFFNNFRKFDVQKIKKISENHINGTQDNSSIIYALISFQEWYKTHINK